MKNILKSGLLVALVCSFVACEQQGKKKDKGHHSKKTSVVTQQVEAPAATQEAAQQ